MLDDNNTTERQHGIDADRQIITRSLFPNAKSRQEVIEQMIEEYSRHDLPSPEVLASIYGRILK